MEADTSQSQWPPELDALKAAPRHLRLLLENDAVRVIGTLVAAGDTTPVHTHRWASVGYYVSGTELVRRDRSGNDVAPLRPTRRADG